jgi:hypothetical protein
LRRSRFTEADVITCAVCGLTTPRASQNQKYCATCSGLKDLERKRKWARVHPLPNDVSYAKSRKLLSKARARGVAISADAGRSITWMAEPPPALSWVVRISHPFKYGLSKNAIYTMGIKGHVVLRKEARALREALALDLKTAMGSQRVFQGKVWLDILVQKPNHKGDAVNVVDTVCDSVKEVLGVDDRWFSIRRLDWEICKTDPRIFLGVGQSITEDHRACSYCGRLLPYSMFLDDGRECHGCRRKSPVPAPPRQPDKPVVVHFPALEQDSPESSFDLERVVHNLEP